MARGVNKVILIGNLGADPEVRVTPNGQTIVNLSLATSAKWRDKQTGENQERTEWHRVVCFSKLAEIARDYLRKGGKVYVEGSLQTRKWQDKTGQDRYTTEIIANELEMLDSRGGANTAPTSNFTTNTAASSAPAEMSALKESENHFEDDIPF